MVIRITASIFVFFILIAGCKKEMIDEPVVDKTISDPMVWKVPVITGVSHIVAIPNSAKPIVKGKNISHGDYVGLFYDSNGAKVCAGFIEWNDSISANSVTIWGDEDQDKSNPIKNGYFIGEELNWRIYVRSENKTFIPSPVYQTGNNKFAQNGIGVLQSLIVE